MARFGDAQLAISRPAPASLGGSNRASNIRTCWWLVVDTVNREKSLPRISKMIKQKVIFTFSHGKNPQHLLQWEAQYSHSSCLADDDPIQVQPASHIQPRQALAVHR